MRKDVANLIAATGKTIYPMHIGSAINTDNLYKKSIPIKKQQSQQTHAAVAFLLYFDKSFK